MKARWWTVLFLVIIALLVSALGYVPEAKRLDLELNLFSELMGAAIAVSLGAFIATRVADGKIRKLVDVIRALRLEGKISPPAARASVICVVNLVSATHLATKRRPAMDSGPQDCSVCGLTTDTHTERGILCCRTCGLKGDQWL